MGKNKCRDRKTKRARIYVPALPQARKSKMARQFRFSSKNLKQIENTISDLESEKEEMDETYLQIEKSVEMLAQLEVWKQRLLSFQNKVSEKYLISQSRYTQKLQDLEALWTKLGYKGSFERFEPSMFMSKRHDRRNGIVGYLLSCKI